MRILEFSLQGTYTASCQLGGTMSGPHKDQPMRLRWIRKSIDIFLSYNQEAGTPTVACLFVVLSYVQETQPKTSHLIYPSDSCYCYWCHTDTNCASYAGPCCVNSSWGRNE